MPDSLLVPVSEAAKMLGVSRSMLYIMAADGRLGPIPIQFGRKCLYRVTELREWTQANCPPRPIWLKRQEVLP
jgi:excisionase family DNA binding protein